MLKIQMAKLQKKNNNNDNKKICISISGSAAGDVIFFLELNKLLLKDKHVGTLYVS